ncbi:hypothetical protein [Mastigocoleus testarum]|uniref:Uncharacterized protein n=1 Tax=Mastigocoleus testarum BC008 TaxID=371196 RepID=A0A0V7ZMP5_9CYAN|nr:hypothetical protein [Mastigocoleus testarum]KST65820.1 hypothetical protein BC008_22835 [Mastigocoleus testarum BC008]
MQTSFSTKLIDLVTKREAKNLAYALKHQINKNNLNQLAINIFKTLNIDEMCNALLKNSHIILSHFNDFQFILGKNHCMRQIYVQLSAKLTKAFGICFQALFNFFSQEIFCEHKT